MYIATCKCLCCRQSRHGPDILLLNYQVQSRSKETWCTWGIAAKLFRRCEALQLSSSLNSCQVETLIGIAQRLVGDLWSWMSLNIVQLHIHIVLINFKLSKTMWIFYRCLTLVMFDSRYTHVLLSLMKIIPWKASLLPVLATFEPVCWICLLKSLSWQLFEISTWDCIAI